MEAKKQRGHELRTCHHCGGPLKVYNSDASRGAGKYCSEHCQAMGKSLYPRILALLPATLPAIAAKLGLPVLKVSQSIGRMAKRDLLHPCGIVPGRADGSVHVLMLFKPGPQDDEKAPRLLNKALPYFVSKAILGALPASTARISEITGLDHSTITVRLRAMRAVVSDSGWQQVCFIRSYKRTLGRGGAFVPIYERGPGKDQPCKLKRHTPQEKWARAKRSVAYLQKKRERAEQAAAKRQRRVAERRQIREGDPLLNAFFGSPADRRKQDRRAGK